MSPKPSLFDLLTNASRDSDSMATQTLLPALHTHVDRLDLIYPHSISVLTTSRTLLDLGVMGSIAAFKKTNMSPEERKDLILRLVFSALDEIEETLGEPNGEPNSSFGEKYDNR